MPYSSASRGRQHRALGVVDQAQHQRGIAAAVTQGVEPSQAGDAGVEHTLAALRLDLVAQVAGQRGDDLDARGGQEFGQILLAGFSEDGEIAAIDDAHPQGACPGHEVAKVRVQLGRAAGEVQGLDAAARQHCKDGFDGVAVHALGAVRPRRDMAMQTGQIAAVAQIGLKNLQAAATDRGKVAVAQARECGMHDRLAWLNWYGGFTGYARTDCARPIVRTSPISSSRSRQACRRWASMHRVGAALVPGGGPGGNSAKKGMASSRSGRCQASPAKRPMPNRISWVSSRNRLFRT